jgi:hypothetical protein
VDEETGADMVKTISVDVPFLLPSDEYPQAIKRKLILLMTYLYHVYFYPATEGVEAFNFSAVEDIDEMVTLEECFMTDALIALGTGKTKKDILPHIRDSNQS